MPPGTLTWPAWQVLRSGPVLVHESAAGHLPALRDAGVDVEPGKASADGVRGRADADQTVVWLTAEDPGEALGDLPVEQVVGSYDPPGARLLDVVAVMDRLRSPGGCPWDAEQTHASLKPYLLEEAYEAYQALEDGDLGALREELGDVLLQVAFHARLAQEAADPWSVDDVAADLVDKLVRRHPHVFAGASADDLDGQWDALKAAEKQRASVTEGVPLGQPALSLAGKLQKRAGKLGVQAPAYPGLGGELWTLVARCRAEGVDAEEALRAVARGFRDRLAEAESAVRREGRDPADVTAQEWAQRLS
jgi:XTP/dITP diphosphohydrolase